VQVYIYKAVSELTVNSDIMLVDLQSAKWKQDNIIIWTCQFVWSQVLSSTVTLLHGAKATQFL